MAARRKRPTDDGNYWALFQNAGDAIFVHDEDSILAVNQKACDLLGYTEDEFLSLGPSEVDAPEQRIHMPTRIERLRRLGSLSFETVHRRKDGSPIPVEVSARLIEWDGAPAVMSICRDVTRRKRAENALLATAIEWQDTFDAVKDAIFLLGSDARILRCNKASANLFVKPVADIIGKHCWEVVHGTQDPHPLCPIIPMMKSRKREKAVLQVGGQWLDVTVDPILDDDGELCGIVHIAVDITARKKIEAELREHRVHLERLVAERSTALVDSEKKYRELVENTNSIILMMDPVGKISFFNEFAQSFFGYSGEEIVGSNVLGTIVPGTDTNGNDLAEMILALGRHPEGFRNNLNENMKKSGERVWIAWTNRPVLDENGKVKEILCVGNDITDRIRAERELEQYRDSLEALVKARTEELEQANIELDKYFSLSLDMLCIANTEGRFLRLNPAWTVTLGFTAADLMKGRFIEFVHPDDVNPTMEAMAQLANQEMVADFVNRFRCKNGTYRWLEWRSQPFGSLIYAVARDITERRQAEQALRESEGRYRTLFESTRDALMTLSPPDWKFTSANPAIAEMFGARDIRDFIALAPWELSPERQPDGQLSNEKAREMIDIAVKDGYNFFEWTHRRINGEVFPATVLLSRLDINNELILQATVRDVSDQKRAEAERERLEARMRHAEKMEAVGQLAGGIAHDFNNQLMGIMGYAELLINRLDNPTLREDADSILRASRRAADLTRDLLAFSRKGKYLTVPVNVHKVIEESVTMLERSIDKRIEIRRELKASPAMITGDPTQMQNALLNLAINARDALPNGGTITFTTETVDMKTVFAKADRHKAVKGRYLKICVIDNGKGMDEETMKHIFEPFFTTKEPGKGTGMGLASVYGTVKSHHGVVDAKSTLGEGSEFSMCFPLLEIHDDSAAGDTRPVPARREATILLVDDDEIVRNLVSSMLRALGHKVVACKDGAEAVDLYRQSWPDIDIVLLDMVMPRMNGRDAFFAMRALNKEMKAILISGFSIDGEAQSLLDAGMKKFIQKPFSMRELSVTIDEVISSAPRPGPC